MSAAEAVYDALAVSLALDQAGEAQFRQVLAGDRGAALGDGGEAGDVEFGVAQRPQHADSGRVGEQREGGDCGADLFGGQAGGCSGGGAFLVRGVRVLISVTRGTVPACCNIFASMKVLYLWVQHPRCEGPCG